MQTRQAINEIEKDELRTISKKMWSDISKLKTYDNHINHISITKDALPDDTEEFLNKYLTYCSKITDKAIQIILKFAAFTVLEEIRVNNHDSERTIRAKKTK